MMRVAGGRFRQSQLRVRSNAGRFVDIISDLGGDVAPYCHVATPTFALSAFGSDSSGRAANSQVVLSANRKTMIADNAEADGRQAGVSTPNLVRHPTEYEQRNQIAMPFTFLVAGCP
jgi:hypothetical protein